MQIPEEERDRGLKDYFKNDEWARKTILAWAVRGCLEWVKKSEGGADGLEAPEKVSAATNEYQRAMHPLYEFIKNECKVGVDEKTGKPYEVLGDDLWDAFTSNFKHYYTRSLQSTIKSRLSFGKHLSSYGFARRRETRGINRQYYWVGLRLLEEGEDSSAGAAPAGAAHPRPDDPLNQLNTQNPPKRDEYENFPVNEGTKGTSGHPANEEPGQNAPAAHKQCAGEPQHLSDIPQLIHDYLLFVKQQQQGKKLRPDLLRSMVANKVEVLSEGQYGVQLVLEYYDRLISQDKQISALVSSICGGEPLRGAH